MLALRRSVFVFALSTGSLAACATASSDEVDATVRDARAPVGDARTDGTVARTDAAVSRLDSGATSSNRDARTDTAPQSVAPGSAGPGEACTDDVDCGGGANCCDRTHGTCGCRYALACDLFWCSGP